MLLPVAGLAFLAERQEKLAFRRELPDDVESVICRPDVIVTIDAKTMRYFERALAPAFDVTPVLVELKQRRLTAMQDVNATFGVDFYRRHRVELHLRRNIDESRRPIRAGISSRQAHASSGK